MPPRRRTVCYSPPLVKVKSCRLCCEEDSVLLLVRCVFATVAAVGVGSRDIDAEMFEEDVDAVTMVVAFNFLL